MKEYCDGRVFSTHPLFLAILKPLQIFFYYDELEVCNPLGSKTKIHKLGIYMHVLLVGSLFANESYLCNKEGGNQQAGIS